MWYRTLKFIENGIKPVYVFDGKPPTLKSGEVRVQLRAACVCCTARQTMSACAVVCCGFPLVMQLAKRTAAKEKATKDLEAAKEAGDVEDIDRCIRRPQRQSKRFSGRAQGQSPCSCTHAGAAFIAHP